VTERTRENLREIQAGRHGGDERSGPLWLRPARHNFARALLRTKNSERHQSRRSHLPCKRNSSRGFSRQVCLSQGLFTKPSGFRKRRPRCRCMSETNMTTTSSAAAGNRQSGSDSPAIAEPPREKLTKKAITADHPTWCPGCGDFAVLAAFYKVLEKRQLDHEKIVTLAGIGCSSRFPYFVNGHGAHYIHGRAVPLASGISLARPDLHIFLFGGDGDGFSIGGNHLDHGARKNINMTYFIMDNFVYGLKKQTSPT